MKVIIIELLALHYILFPKTVEIYPVVQLQHFVLFLVSTEISALNKTLNQNISRRDDCVKTANERETTDYLKETHM